MKLALLTICLLALAVARIAIKILVKKNGQFTGTCASNNPLVNTEGEPCGICGVKPTKHCKSPFLLLFFCLQCFAD